MRSADARRRVRLLTPIVPIQSRVVGQRPCRPRAAARARRCPPQAPRRRLRAPPASAAARSGRRRGCRRGPRAGSERPGAAGAVPTLRPSSTVANEPSCRRMLAATPTSVPVTAIGSSSRRRAGRERRTAQRHRPARLESRASSAGGLEAKSPRQPSIPPQRLPRGRPSTVMPVTSVAPGMFPATRSRARRARAAGASARPRASRPSAPESSCERSSLDDVVGGHRVGRLSCCRARRASSGTSRRRARTRSRRRRSATATAA